MAQKDYKDTLLLPKTDFPMRGNLGVKEVEIQQRWNDLDLFNKVQEKNKNNLEYIFMMDHHMQMVIFTLELP